MAYFSFLKHKCMATLYFKIGADYEKVIRLRDEIKKLENQLKSFGTSTPDAEIKRTEERLASSRQEFTRLATEAAKAGAVMESDLRRKINSVTKASDDLSEEIIKQRKIIRETQEDVRRLSEQYSKMGKYSPKSESTLNQLNKAKAALAEQRYAMGDLQDQQARNRLELRKLNREYADFSQGSDKAKMAAESFMSSLKRTAAEIGGIAAIKQFTSQVINATGTMQQLQVSLSTILQDEGKAKELIGEITQFAAKTPFNLDDVASGAKQLLAYGSSAENVVEELSMLGDVASGLQIPIGQLIYLYGTLRTQGRAMTVDIRQFAGRGIPIYEELAKVLGVSKDQVGELVKEGKVGFKEVEQAFKNMTSEGGKFNDLMENSAGTWPQRISNMQDKLFQSLNNFGNRYKEIFETGMDITEGVVDHLEDILSVIIPLIAAYGTYRAALIAVGVAQKAAGFVESIKLIAMMRKELGMATAAQQAFNVASKANVYVAIASAIIALGTAIYMFSQRTDEATESQKRLQDAQDNYRKSVDTELAQMDKLFDNLKKAKKGTDDYQEAKDAIVENYGSYLNGLDEEIRTLKNVEGAYDAVRKAIVKTARARGMDAAVKGAQEAYGEKYGKASGNLYDLMSRETGEASAKIYLNQVRSEIEKTGKISKSTRKEIAGLFSSPGRHRNFLRSIREMEEATKDLGDSYKKAEAIFGEDTDNKGSGWTGNTVTVKNKSYWEKKKKEAEEAREALDSQKSNSKEWKEYTRQIMTAEKELAKYSSPTKQSDRDEKQRESAAKKREKAQETADKNLLALQQKNQDDEIALMQDGTKKKLAEIDNDYKKRVAEIGKQEAEFKKKNLEAGNVSLNGKGLTKEQQDEISKSYELANKEREKSVSEAHREELESMRDYLKQWGSMEQKRLAISEEYSEKIANARNEGERKSLEKEREKALSSLTFENISMGIDWKGLLSGVSSLSKETLEPMLRQLEAYTKTDEYAKADMDERQKVVDLIKELRQYVGTDQEATWQELAKAIEAFNEAVASYRDAASDEKKAVEDLAAAKGKLERGDITQADYDKLKTAADQLGERTVEAKDEMQSLANSVNEQSDQVANQVSPLSAALNNAKGWQGAEGFDQLRGSSASIDQLKGTLDTLLLAMQDGQAKAIGSALSDGMGKLSSSLGGSLSSVFSSGVGSIVGVVAQIPSMILQLADTIKNFVTGILNSISELLSLDWISDLVNSILGAIGNLIDTILDLPENLFHVLEGIVVQGVGGLLNSVVGRLGNILSFGALSSGGPAEWFSGSNAEEVAKTIERLTERNKLLQQSIEDLTSTIEGGEGTRSVTAYEEAVRLQEEMEQNLLEMARAQAGYSGSHHSWNAYWGGFTQDEIAELSRRIGRDWNGDLFDLSPEEMKELRSMVDTWARIQNTGKGGYGGRLTEKLDDYIEQAGQMEELTDQLNESLTQVSFDSIYDSFIDTLMDMDASAEDFANDFSKYIMRSMLSNQVGEDMKKQLEDWYGKWAEYMKDNKLTDMELSDLRGEWDNMVQQGLEMRDQLAEAIGYTGESSKTEQQSASSKGFETMSQDTAEELNGRFTAMYEAELRITDITTEQLAVLKAIYGQMGGNIADVASEGKQILSTSYIQQNNISFPTAQLDALVAKVEGLDAKVADLVSFGADNRLSMQGVDTYIENSTKNNNQSLSLLNDIKRNTQGL